MNIGQDELMVSGLLRVRAYLSLLAKCEFQSWSEVHDQYLAGKLQFAESLVLIHPMWYEAEGEKVRDCPVRSVPNFDGTSEENQRCESSRFWGYECPLPMTGVQADHCFPRSLGGPTDPDNQAWLCKWHNQIAKGADIHLLDLRAENMLWFERTLARVKNQV